jgi:hypothetical protein
VNIRRDGTRRGNSRAKSDEEVAVQVLEMRLPLLLFGLAFGYRT